MNLWKEWTLSSEAESRLVEMSSKLCLEKNYTWLNLLNYDPDCKSTNTNTDMEIDFKELTPKEEENIIKHVKESLKADIIFPEEKLLGISDSSLNKIFLGLHSCLTESDFSAFCKCIVSWTDNNLIENALKFIVLPKLKEKSESSACTIHFVKEIAVKKPDKLCHVVLVPLLTDDSFQFTDVELLSNVISVLETAHKDLLIMILTKKTEVRESDWTLIQPFLQDISLYSFNNALECLHRFSKKFEKSQVFGRFLVEFCKNLEYNDNKQLLIEAIEGHQTLFKRQALKYLKALQK